MSPAQPPEEPPRAPLTRPHAFTIACLAIVGLASAFETRLSIFGVLLLVIGLASLSRVREPERRLAMGALTVSMVFAVIGLGRFVLNEALPGIIEAGGRASGGRAVSRLREILFAQDASRRLGLIDPDGNGIGGAGRLAELTGAAPVRGLTRLETPPLAPQHTPRVDTPTGDAAEDGEYLFIVCVPAASGGFTARLDDPVDEPRAERAFLAYAWPASPDAPSSAAYFLDEHERILESPNRAQGDEPAAAGDEPRVRPLRLVGATHAPSCTDAIAPETAGEWRPWRGKQPRKHLVGAPSTP